MGSILATGFLGSLFGVPFFCWRLCTRRGASLHRPRRPVSLGRPWRPRGGSPVRGILLRQPRRPCRSVAAASSRGVTREGPIVAAPAPPCDTRSARPSSRKDDREGHFAAPAAAPVSLGRPWRPRGGSPVRGLSLRQPRRPCRSAARGVLARGHP